MMDTYKYKLTAIIMIMGCLILILPACGQVPVSKKIPDINWQMDITAAIKAVEARGLWSEDKMDDTFIRYIDEEQNYCTLYFEGNRLTAVIVATFIETMEGEDFDEAIENVRNDLMDEFGSAPEARVLEDWLVIDVLMDYDEKIFATFSDIQAQQPKRERGFLLSYEYYKNEDKYAILVIGNAHQEEDYGYVYTIYIDAVEITNKIK